MFYSLKIAVRNIRSNGIYSVINIIGLSVSLSVAILILLWVNDEMSVDKFHQKGKDIYQTIATFNIDGKDLYWKTSSPLVSLYSQAEIPEIENSCRIQDGNWSFMHDENRTGTVKGLMADSSFFSMFNFPLLEGDIGKPFADRRSVVLSRKIATVLFGQEEAVGKIIRADGSLDLQVTGIMEDMPENTAFHCDAVFPFDLRYESGSNVNDSWSALGPLTFFLLKSGADPHTVAQRISGIQQKNFSDVKITYLLQPLLQNHFYDAEGKENAAIQTSRLFTVTVFILLIIACINYVNLVTARFSKRNKELLVKKILGAGKGKLFLQSMLESTLLFLVAILLATLIIYIVFPFFCGITGKNMELRLFSMDVLALYALTFTTVTLLAGVFPALSLSFKNPFQAIQGKKSVTSGPLLFRRILVILQFVSATVLISGSLVINGQMQFIRQKNPGYSRENVMVVDLSASAAQQYDELKSRLLQQPGVLGVASATEDILNVSSESTWNYEDNKNIMISTIETDKDFIPTMGLRLVEGTNFTGTPADNSHFLLNETAVSSMGITDPVGKSVEFRGKKGSIIGVVNDFTFQDFRKKLGPLIVCFSGEPSVMYIRLEPHSMSKVIALLESVWKSSLPATPFEYHFLDDDFNKLYKSDIRVNRLFNCFAVIAIVISCLGLFGLVTFIAETKIKEIGIRKVLGAGVRNIVGMLIGEFLLLAGIAMLVAFPLAYYWLDKMLQDYAYRIGIGWWMFATAGLILTVLTLLTVGWKAIRAATTNPVKAIKAE